MGLRDGFYETAVTTNLIVHHCISDIFNQACKPICILNIGEKTLSFSLLLQWLQFLKNVLQLPNNQCSSVSDLIFWQCRLTLPVSVFSSVP
jgi:hypothetical protein